MFSLSHPNKSHIQEANKHLHLLHDKIEKLEAQLANQELLSREREKELSDALEFATQCSESEVIELKNEIRRKNCELSDLGAILKERDTTIARLQHRCAVLDYIAKHRNVLEDIVSVLSGVQRIDQKAAAKGEDRISFDKELSEFSRKTEAHGILETHSSRMTSQKQEPYKTFDGRFSITDLEEDVDDKHTNEIRDDVFVRQKSNSEHYL